MFNSFQAPEVHVVALAMSFLLAYTKSQNDLSEFQFLVHTHVEQGLQNDNFWLAFLTSRLFF